METLFLASENGTVFLWETDRTGLRIHELASLDTLQQASNGVVDIEKSDILDTSVAGQSYRMYIMPIRVLLSEAGQNNSASLEKTKWILGGLVPQSEYRQESLALDPNMALFLSFLVISGFLLVPFIRIITMGPKERLKVGNILYLVIALIFGSGLAGLWLADLVYFSPLKQNVSEQMDKTANRLAINIDTELQNAINELKRKSSEFEQKYYEAVKNLPHADSTVSDSLLMRTTIGFQPDELDSTYLQYQMVFWTNSEGMQIAKWTPRNRNTSRISLSSREYFRAISDDRAWTASFYTDDKSNTCTTSELSTDTGSTYFIESIRSMTTGENIAALSIPRVLPDSSKEAKGGIAAMTMQLASLTNPVLPAGVGFAVIDEEAKTLFHSRSERVLDENFVEETGNEELLRSLLAARTCADIEMKYEGENKLMVIRPLPGRPLFLILYKDLSLVDTVRFEAWFEGGALLGIWVVCILLLIFLLELLPGSRLDWLWPDLENPGKYTIFVLYSIPFILYLLFRAGTVEHLHIHPASLLIPLLYLGLGLVILSRGYPPQAQNNKHLIGWVLFSVAFLMLFIFTFVSFIPSNFLLYFAMLMSLAIVFVWLRMSDVQKYIRRWSKDSSPKMLYTAAMVCGLIVLGLLPGYLSYRFTFQDHNEHLVKYHQIELAKSLEERRNRIRDLMEDTWEVTDVWNESEYAEIFGKDYYDMAFDSLIFRTQITDSSGIDSDTDDHQDHDPDRSYLHQSMHALLGNRIPFLTDVSIQMRQLSSEQSDRKWIPQGENAIAYIGGGPTAIISDLNVPDSWADVWRFPILLAVVSLLFLVVYRVSRRIFFDYLEHSEPLTLEDILPKPNEAWRSTILVGTRSISRMPLHDRGSEVYYIDLISDIEDPAELNTMLKKELPKEARVICLDYFDHRIDEIKRNEALLEFLEKYVTPNTGLPVILFTSQEPDNVLLTSQIPDTQKEEMRKRWDRVLGRFSKMVLSDYVSEKPFKALVQLRTIQKVLDDLDTLLQKLNQELPGYQSGRKNPDITEPLVELSLKTEWLNEEILKLLTLNSEFSKQHRALASQIITDRIILEDMKTLIERMESDKVSSKKIDDYLEKLTNHSDTSHILFDRLAEISFDKSQPVDGYSDYPTEHLILNYLNRLSIWFLVDSEREAERVVYRDRKQVEEICATLLEECGKHERLHEIGEQLLYRPDWHSLTRKEIIDLVREGAEAHYRARWAILSHGEKLVAAQLSRGAVVNPKSHRAISSLFSRGLIKRSPELRLDNVSFAGFVESTVSDDQLIGWERAGIPSTWEMIRAPLVIALIVVALFLFWSQREFLGNTIAFLGTIGVGVGAIFNLLSKFSHITGSSDAGNSGK